MNYLIVLTIGPVQSYISQARRTHDLFQGSRILSYLAGVGVYEAHTLIGNDAVIYPHLQGEIDDPYASIPNRIVIAHSGAEADAEKDAKSIADVIQLAWNDVSQNTLAYFIRKDGDDEITGSNEVESIWVTQARTWLECYWVVVPTDEGAYSANIHKANSQIGARKMIRDFSQIDEVGRKDSITGEHAVLQDDPARKNEVQFWKDRKAEQRNRALLSSSERLGAISAIKRFAHEERPRGTHINPDLKIEHRYPSTSSIATASFKYDVLVALYDDREGASDLLKALKDFIHALIDCYDGDAHSLFFSKDGNYNPEYFPKIWGILPRDLTRRIRVSSNVNDEWDLQFMCIDGDYLFDDTLIVKTIEEYLPPIEAEGDELKKLEKQRRRYLKPKVAEAHKTLKTLIKVASAPNYDIAPPYPYLAILSMDGDNMGKTIRSLKGIQAHRAFSETLSIFARDKVGSVVQDDHLGRVVYAGGDDVLALVTVRDALTVAETLRTDFAHAVRNFENHEDKPVTASTGIAFVHHTHDLQSAVNAANTAQKNIAKDDVGRDAIGIRLLRRSGEPRQMGSKWAWDGVNLVSRIELLIHVFSSGQLSRSLPSDIERINYQMGGDVPSEAREAEIKRVIHRRMNSVEEGLEIVEEEEIVDVIIWLQTYTPNLLQVQHWVELARFIAQKESNR